MPKYEAEFSAIIEIEAPNAAAASAALRREGIGELRLISASAGSLRSPSGALKRVNDWFFSLRIKEPNISTVRRSRT
jgi:hypothetical protein